jgi:putative two-component system response regulator
MGATILLAVADLKARKAWNELLTCQGYRIIGIGSGERVPDLCLHLRPDLVLVEASLPDISGFEVCRRLKQDSRNRLTPVVVIAPLTDDSDLSHARDAGADDFWDARPSRWEALTRIQSLLLLKTYIDEQGEAVIFSLARSIEARDTYTRGHCERLSSLAVKLGSRIGLSADDLNALRIAGIVHDIGKVIVPDAILMKPGRLTFEEMKIIEEHPVAGERICSPLKSLRRVLPIIRYHHERMDGSGYPDGLRGNKIPLGARTLQIVDIFDALTTDRPYRRALSLQEALKTMYEEAERGWIDAELVSVFATTAVMFKPSWAIESGETYQRAQAI